MIVDDARYMPDAPTAQVRQLPDVPQAVDADYWDSEDIDMSSNLSSSSRSSSLGPETPCDSGDESPFMLRIRKRKSTEEEEEEELQQPKHIMKKRWSTSSNAKDRSSRRKAIYIAPPV